MDLCHSGGWQNRGTRSYTTILCLVNSLLEQGCTSNADLIFAYLPNKVKPHYKNGFTQKKILTWQFRGKGRNLSVRTPNSFAVQWTHEGKGKEDKREGRESRGREGWKEIEDTSWVQFRGFPQEVEWPVSATIEVMQFLVDTSLFREYWGPLLWCAHPEEKLRVPISHRTPLNDPTGRFPLRLPRYTAAVQLTLHSKLQHQQSAELSSTVEVAMKSAIQRNYSNPSSSCLSTLCLCSQLTLKKQTSIIFIGEM